MDPGATAAGYPTRLTEDGEAVSVTMANVGSARTEAPRNRCRRRELLRLMSDADLVSLCLSGDDDAWKTLVDRFQRLVISIPLAGGLPFDDAAEIAQITFVRLIDHLSNLENTDAVRVWLLTTARRLTIDEYRKKQRRRQAAPLIEGAAEDPLPDAAIEHLEDVESIRTALESMGEPCRPLLKILYYGRGGDIPAYTEVSRQLGLPVGSIGPTRGRCLAKLLQIFRKERP